MLRKYTYIKHIYIYILRLWLTLKDFLRRSVLHTGTLNFLLKLSNVFRISDVDFTGLGAFSNTTYRNPRYVHSPYGSWLAISNSPTTDTFSQWFRSESGRNRHYDEKLELRKQLETDSNGNTVFRHFDDKFFPVDGRGFGAEGQRDCLTNALRNYGYVYTPSSNFFSID